MKFVNDSKDVTLPDGKVLKAVTVRIPRFNIVVAPGETCDVPDAYAWPRRSSGGARIKSTIESLAPQLKPADPKIREEWLQAPPEEGRKTRGSRR